MPNVVRLARLVAAVVAILLSYTQRRRRMFLGSEKIAAKVEMSDQEWFNVVWEHAKLLTPGTRNGECLYYVPLTGARCFIGAAAPNVATAQSWDGVAEGLCLRGRIGVADMPQGQQVIFLSELQEIHDEAEIPEDWEIKLREFAVRWNLKVPSE